MKTFKVNEFISLKLERGTTNIYVKGELFIQCKFLLLTIPTNNALEDIDSIDEASDYLDYSLDPDTEYVEPEKKEIIDGISPETEFWAHCSNLQTWAEYNYDTRLLHRNLAFPLLNPSYNVVLVIGVASVLMILTVPKYKRSSKLK